MALSGRLAIIAGGLGGIGSATGRALLARGANLALLYAPFESSKLSQLLESGYGPSSSSPPPSSTTKIRTYECDITSPTSVNTAFSTLQQHLHDIPKDGSRIFPNILANCAGYVSLSPLEDTPPEEIQLHLNNNILGPMLVSQAFANMYFRACDEATESNGPVPPGRIISISSQAAHVALANHGAYCASKAGLIGLTKCMASEWGGRGITANTISPGVVWTALGKKAWPDEGVRKAYMAAIPSGRFAEPEEVAGVVDWLAGDETGMVNGADVRLDGGFTIR